MNFELWLALAFVAGSCFGFVACISWLRRRQGGDPYQDTTRTMYGPLDGPTRNGR